MSEIRERWASRPAFVMAAIGSAVGLGNLWRFPYIAASHGGGAFLIPYFVAVLTTGIPVAAISMMETGTPPSASPSSAVMLGERKTTVIAERPRTPV